jgi:hypothetical protein
MGHLGKRRSPSAFARLLALGLRGELNRRGKARKSGRSIYPDCENLEGRVVLSSSAAGGNLLGGLANTVNLGVLPGGVLPPPPNLLGALNYVGVVTGPIGASPVPRFPVLPLPVAAATSTSTSQLNSDVRALWTELESLASKSGVTIADVESLVSDSQAIDLSAFQFNDANLKSVISELATAVAGGTSTTQAQADFTNLFTGSTVSSTVITNTFNDLVKAITDSNVTTTDLSTVAKDEAAIQADLSNLPKSWQPVGSKWLASLEDLPGVASTLAVTSSLSATNPVEITAAALPNLPVRSIGPILPTPPIGILPFPGYGLFSSLNYVGVVTQPVLASATAPTSSNPKLQQLDKDLQALQTELQSLATTSGLTVAELQSLTVDSQAIAQAGYHFNAQKLNPVISELAGAVAAASSTSQAESAFDALFTGSSVSTTVISNTFSDLVKAIGSSKVTTTDLSTVASDEAAIQTDLKNLHGSSSSSGSSGSSSGSSSSNSGSSSGSSGSSSGSSGSSSGSSGSSRSGTKGSGHHHHRSPVLSKRSHGEKTSDSTRSRKR